MSSLVPFALAASLLAAPVLAETRRYALVIGVNRPAAEGLKPLRFADDDAVRTHEVFAAVPGRASLLAELDEETQRLHPEAVAKATLPTRAEVLSRAEELFEAIRAERKAGDTAELYFVFSGHGRVNDKREGSLELLDGSLPRREMYEKIVARSPADLNHLVIDACDSYFFVNNKGDALGEALKREAEGFLSRDSLDQYPNTGVIVSTSGAAESFEWSQIQAGVFSHLLRSALLGAADVDGDGAVRYAEVEAFLVSAAVRMKHARAQLKVFARAPQVSLAHPLFAPAQAATGTLLVDASLSGRMSVEDQRGIRYADFNKSAEGPLTLALLSREKYFVTTAKGEYGFAPEGRIELAALTPGERRAESRAGVAEALDKDLLAAPFGQSFLEGYSAKVALQQSIDLSHQEERRPMRVIGLVAAGGAVGGAAFGFFSKSAASRSFAEYQAATNPDQIRALQARTQAQDGTAMAAFGTAAALGATAAALLIVDHLQH